MPWPKWKWIQDLTIRPESVSYIEENIELSIENIELSILDVPNFSWEIRGFEASLNTQGAPKLSEIPSHLCLNSLSVLTICTEVSLVILFCFGDWGCIPACFGLHLPLHFRITPERVQRTICDAGDQTWLGTLLTLLLVWPYDSLPEFMFVPIKTPHSEYSIQWT